MVSEFTLAGGESACMSMFNFSLISSKQAFTHSDSGVALKIPSTLNCFL